MGEEGGGDRVEGKGDGAADVAVDGGEGELFERGNVGEKGGEGWFQGGEEDEGEDLKGATAAGQKVGGALDLRWVEELVEMDALELRKGRARDPRGSGGELADEEVLEVGRAGEDDPAGGRGDLVEGEVNHSGEGGGETYLQVVLTLSESKSSRAKRSSRGQRLISWRSAQAPSRLGSSPAIPPSTQSPDPTRFATSSHCDVNLFSISVKTAAGGSPPGGRLTL